MLIPVTGRIALDSLELTEKFSRSAGAGGQNVQKVETRVQLRLDVGRSPSLPEAVKRRLAEIAGQRMSGDGVLTITADEHRSRERNREAALARLLDLIREAAVPPPPKRRPTRPTLGSKKRRLEGKAARSSTKQLRSRPRAE